MLCAIAVGVLGFALQASAAAAPHVVVHPLIVVADDSRVVDESRADFIGQAARQPIEMVSRVEVADAVERVGGSCQEREGCLEKLCAATGATYAVLALLDVKGPRFVLKARVVAADGTVARSVASLEIEKDLLSPRARQVQAAFKQLFIQLDLGSLPLTLPKKVAPPVVKPPPPVVVASPPPVVVAPPPPVVAPPVALPLAVTEPVERSTGTSPLRVAGFVVGGVGVVALGFGAGLAGSAASTVIPTVQLNGKTFLVTAADAPRAAAVNAQASAATGLLIGGGVAVAAAAIMVLLGADSGPALVVTPVQGGAIVGIHAEF